MSPAPRPTPDTTTATGVRRVSRGKIEMAKAKAKPIRKATRKTTAKKRTVKKAA
jgi:hypothetical protein